MSLSRKSKEWLAAQTKEICISCKHRGEIFIIDGDIELACDHPKGTGRLKFKLDDDNNLVGCNGYESK